MSLSKFGVECYILTPYEKSQTISKGVEVVCIANFLQRFGLNDWVYRLTKNAYYSGFLMRNLVINERWQRFLGRLSENIANVVERLNIDLVQVEQDIVLLATMEVGKRTMLPFVADIHNVTSEELVAARVIKRDSDEFDTLQNRTRDALQNLNSIIVVSAEMKNYVVANYGISSNRVVVVPPGGRPRVNEINEKAYPPKVIYSGSVALREHLDLFVNSMPIIREKSKDVQFYITNKGHALKNVKQLAKELGVHPSFFWFPDERNFYEFLASCHVGVLPSSSDIARQMGTPVKLFDYLAAGLPVVVNDVGTWTNIIKDEGVGIVTKDDPKDFASGVLQLIQNQEFATACGHKGLELVKNKYNWDNSAKILLYEYQHLVS